MSPETLKALRASIAKWEANLEHAKDGRFGDVTIGWATCPMCVMFNNPDKLRQSKIGPCHGCPVRDRTGMTACNGTPYPKVETAIARTHPMWIRDLTEDQISIICADAVVKIQAEVDFLISLLPEGAK